MKARNALTLMIRMAMVSQIEIGWGAVFQPENAMDAFLGSANDGRYRPAAGRRAACQLKRA
jgi:hypothetical protein